KEKIVPGLQSLCVSILDDSNADMEKSVNDITDYMSKTTSNELKRKMEALSQRRGEICQELAQVRKKLYDVILQERGTINFKGEELSPSVIGNFLFENSEELSYITGPVDPQAEIPLTRDELVALYRSNGDLSSSDEAELKCDLPDPSFILDPETFLNLHNSLI
ncbi:hypothetical protein IJT10_03400, partial [bacterium]|nr:hypothetical protein [bacterium]